MTTRIYRKRLIALALALTLGACGGEQPESEPAAEEAAPPDDSLEKAKAVDQQVQQRKQDVDRALEEAEGETDDDE